MPGCVLLGNKPTSQRHSQSSLSTDGLSRNSSDKFRAVRHIVLSPSQLQWPLLSLRFGGEGRKKEGGKRKEGERGRGWDNCACVQKLANWRTLLMKIQANLPILGDGRYNAAYVEGGRCSNRIQPLDGSLALCPTTKAPPLPSCASESLLSSISACGIKFKNCFDFDSFST